MIPTVDDFRSDTMEHRFGDAFNLPGLTNFLGVVQVALDPVATRCLNFPPFATAETVTASLFIGDRYFASTGAPVRFSWWPDRVVREATWDDWGIRTTTVLPPDRMAVVVTVEIENRRHSARELSVRLALRGGVTKHDAPWLAPSPPTEGEHDTHLDAARGTVAFVARKSGAASVQGTVPRANEVAPDAIAFRTSVGARETWSMTFVNALGPDEPSARATFDALVGNAAQTVQRVRAWWNEQIEAMFTPDNGRFGGSLPVLETTDEDVATIYRMGALGVLYFLRESPYSAIGRSYDTLMPRYWQSVTFLWDYSLSSTVHALLDPAVMRRHLELWMARDIHTCFGTEWLTGGPVGGWYSVNDYAMTKMIHEYVRWSGDRTWLHARVTSPDGNEATVVERLRGFASNWRRFRTASGLADYGGIGNLLECVSTYIHEVAALNAANVFSMRAAAEVDEALGDPAAAAALRDGARELVERIMPLYADGKGYWHTRFPDGSLVPVKHCYDFITVLDTIADDLTPAQRAEMADFCLAELVTPTWMHALACSDPDAAFDVRPDHQWTGAYPAWPPLAVRGLYRAGRPDEALAWLRGLARSANQGPYAQAHFAEVAFPPERGGARKAPSDMPWITDWACSSNGAWVNIVLDSIFGVRASVDGRLTAEPVLTGTDPDARLRGLTYQGRRYDVDARGVHAAKEGA